MTKKSWIRCSNFSKNNYIYKHFKNILKIRKNHITFYNKNIKKILKENYNFWIRKI